MLLFVVLPTTGFKTPFRKSSSTTPCSVFLVVGFGFPVGFPVLAIDAVEVLGAALDLADALEVTDTVIDD